MMSEWIITPRAVKLDNLTEEDIALLEEPNSRCLIKEDVHRPFVCTVLFPDGRVKKISLSVLVEMQLKHVKVVSEKRT